jgi:hypothetical protein
MKSIYRLFGLANLCIVIGDGTFLQRYFGLAAYFNNNSSFFYLDNLTMNSANCHDFITFFQLFPELFLCFAFLLLWPDKEKIEHNQDCEQHEKRTLEKVLKSAAAFRSF